MKKETKELLLKHIKEGTYIADTVFDIQRIMANAGMELYAKPCCERITAAGLVDGVHNFYIEPSPWNIGMDISGMEKCREILEAYLQPGYTGLLQKAMEYEHTLTVINNNTLYQIRKVDKKELRHGRRGLLGNSPETDEAVMELSRAELERRRLPGWMRRLAKRFVFVCQMLNMYQGPLRFLWPVVSTAWKNWDTIKVTPQIDSNGKYSKALRRFTDAHGGTCRIGRLQGADLTRYVYLAVKAYGKENRAEVNHTKDVKPCLEIESRYHEMKQAMEAIGRLTPEELLHMFPVTKEYDGIKWGSKDYFYTMDKLKRLPAGKPIGDAQDAACLMWDYQNWDLTFMLLQWMNVLGDLRIYCNDSRPDDEFHNRLLRRDECEGEGTMATVS